MPFTTDFKPFATGQNALVLTSAALATQPWFNGGFNGGIADAASCNTLWRQGTFVGAGITQWMANVLSQNIFDDGNLSNFISLFGSALTHGSNGGVSSINTRTGAVVLNSTDVTTALGYAPVRSFNGPGGAPRTGVVTLIQADVNQAEGYTPLNRGGDSMTGWLSGPEPSAPLNYATKNYVDRAIAGLTVGGITSFSNEWDFPLPFGGLIKIGQYFPGFAGGLVSGSSYQINFARPFSNVCAGVIIEPAGTSVFPVPPLVPNGAYNTALASSPNTQNFTFWNVIPSTTVGPAGVYGILWTAYGF